MDIYPNLFFDDEGLTKPYFHRHFLVGAGDRSRTGTDITIRRILSPLRLPIPPPRHDEVKNGGGTQNRTGDEGFADLCLTAWLCRRLERKTRLELATPTLARWCSTTELLPQNNWCSGTESNRRHGDFQSPALPTELPEQIWRPRSDLNRRSSP